VIFSLRLTPVPSREIFPFPSKVNCALSSPIVKVFSSLNTMPSSVKA
jgi:hypothetical protein